MVAINDITSAAVLLRRISSDQGALTKSQIAIVSDNLSGISLDATGAQKSVSSAIFNATTEMKEEENRWVKDALAYIDDTYTNGGDELAALKDDPHFDFDGMVQKMKATGELLKQQILSDPSAAHKLFKGVEASRPDWPRDGVFGLFVVELGNRAARQAAKAE